MTSCHLWCPIQCVSNLVHWESMNSDHCENMWFYVQILLPMSALSAVYDITLCLVQARWGFCEPIDVHLLVYLRSVLSTAVCTNQSLRQTDAGQRMIRCCLTSAQCGTCVFSVGLIAWFGHAPTLHSSTGVRVVQGFVYLLVIVW